MDGGVGGGCRSIMLPFVGCITPSDSKSASVRVEVRDGLGDEARAKILQRWPWLSFEVLHLVL